MFYQEAEHADGSPEDAVGCEPRGAGDSRLARASVADSAAIGATRTDCAGVSRWFRQQGGGQEAEEDFPDGGMVAQAVQGQFARRVFMLHAAGPRPKSHCCSDM